MKTCIACGMPMREKSDFAMGDERKDYCIHCANEDGTMHTFEQKKESMVNLIIKTQGLDRTAAEGVALSMMNKLTAWTNYFS
jgi:hypothetical protein